jgi:hypothetical protein
MWSIDEALYAWAHLRPRQEDVSTALGLATSHGDVAMG